MLEGYLTIKKADKDDPGSLLTGAEFKLTKPNNGEIVLTTNANGLASVCLDVSFKGVCTVTADGINSFIFTGFNMPGVPPEDTTTPTEDTTTPTEDKTSSTGDKTLSTEGRYASPEGEPVSSPEGEPVPSPEGEPVPPSEGEPVPPLEGEPVPPPEGEMVPPPEGEMPPPPDGEPVPSPERETAPPSETAPLLVIPDNFVLTQILPKISAYNADFGSVTGFQAIFTRKTYALISAYKISI